MMPNDVYPRPRSIERFDPTRRQNHAPHTILDSTLRPQGYELTVDAEGVTLRYSDDAGRRYGLSTLDQLRDADGTLPHIAVSDWPDIATRGFMLDVSRDRVPTRATLERLVGVLANCRFNHLQLYVEHTFAYARHRGVWHEASPLTAADLRWLDDLCARSGIELAANQNCFGHMGRWLRLPAYRHRAECPDGFEPVPGLRLPATVLEPNEDNAVFALGLVREQIGNLRSLTINIGCDETFELGKGSSRDLVEKEGLGTVYARHLARLIEPLRADGLHIQFWGDVLAHHPDSMAALSTDSLTALVWNYDAPDAPHVDVAPELQQVLAELGIDPNAPTAFASRVQPFVTSGIDFWVAPGTSTWNSLIGRLDNATANLLDAAVVAAASGATGYLVTDWGDGGHHHPLTISYPPIVYGGAVAWCADTNRDLDIASTIDSHIVDDRAGVFGRVLTDIGGIAERTGKVERNASPLLDGLFLRPFSISGGDLDLDLLRGAADTLDAAARDLSHTDLRCRDAATLVGELAVIIDLARFAIATLVGQAGGDIDPASVRAAELASLIDRYRTAWCTTSRPGGLEQSARHLVKFLQRIDAPAD